MYQIFGNVNKLSLNIERKWLIWHIFTELHIQIIYMDYIELCTVLQNEQIIKEILFCWNIMIIIIKHTNHTLKYQSLIYGKKSHLHMQ